MQNELLKIDLEMRLLADCAGVAPDPVRAERVRTAAGRGIDWERLILAARQHGVLPLLYSQLKTISGPGVGDDPSQPSPHDIVPSEILSKLRAECRTSARRNLSLTAELFQLLDLLGRHEIRVVSYKGPLVARSLYGSLAMRPFRDLDILIDQAAVPRATELLASVGYRPLRPLSLGQEQAILRAQGERSFAREHGTVVDVHWQVAPTAFGFHVDPDVWDRIETVSFQGRPVQTFSPADLLLLLCVHGAVHAWDRLIWLADIARVIDQRREIGWDQVVAGARRSGTRRVLFVGLLVARDLLGAPLPADVVEQARNDRMAQALARRVERNLFGEATAGPPRLRRSRSSRRSARRRYFHVMARERAVDRLRYVMRVACTVAPTDRALPPSPSFVHYLAWPIRLLQKYRWGRMAKTGNRCQGRVTRDGSLSTRVNYPG